MAKSDVTVYYTPNDKQCQFHACGADEVVYGGAKGGGKALEINTPIPTPDGWTIMKDLKPGDKVLGENGYAVEILAVTDIMYGRPCYRMKFDDGSEIICDEEHLWKTHTASDLVKIVRPDVAERNKLNLPSTKLPPAGGIRTTGEIAKTLTAPGKQVKRNHAVMLPDALNLPEKTLPIHPYLLGAWLGDGCSSSAIITCGEKELFEKIKAVGYNLFLNKSNNENVWIYRIEGLRFELRKLGLLKNKHIPIDYLRASKEQRLDLLMGLMDTDGYAREHGGVEFVTTNKELAEQVRELVLTLGWKCNIRKGKALLNGNYVSKKYRLVFTPDGYVFKSSRKREAQKFPTSIVKRTKHRFIISCEPVESVPVKCIQVEGGMYLAGSSMIPTHNSCALVMEAMAYGLEHPGATIYLFRETYDDLESNLIAEWKKRVPPEIYSYHGSKYVATMVNGTEVFFRYVRSKQDAESYDGRSIDWLGIDELTKHEEASVQILLSCVRSAKGFPPRFRGTCNPGGPGHRYVKDRYINPTNKGKKQYTDPVTGNKIAFIPATVYDNFAIMQNDPAYVRRLENLPPKKKAAYLHGDWDQYDGQAFEEFDVDIHVVEPFDIPEHWPGWLAVDNGHTDPFAWYWARVDERGIVYIVREFTRDYADQKLTFSQQAQKVMKLSTYSKMENGQVFEYMEPIIPVYCGHDAFASHPLAEGKTIAWYYQQGGLRGLQPVITDRKLRKATWHEYLQPIELTEPDPYTGRMKIAKVQIFNTCTRLIETLPFQMEDEKDPEKVAESNIDHWYDGAGYAIVSWHINRSGRIELPKKQLPFELRSEESTTKDAIQEYLWS